MRRVGLSTVTHFLPGTRTSAGVTAAILIAAIAVADWRVVPNISLGFLYLFPLLLVATWLEPWELAGLALLCMLLREQFSSFRWSGEVKERLAITFLAYLGTSLLVRELNRSRKTALQDAGALAREARAREAAEQQLRALIEGSPAAILTSDPEGTVLLANEAAHHLFGCLPGSLPGSRIDGYLPILASLRGTNHVRHMVRTAVECPAHRRDGANFLAQAWVSSYAMPQGTGLTAVVFDGSEQLRDTGEAALRTLATGARIALGAFWHEARNLSSAMEVVAAGFERFPGLAESEELNALRVLAAGLQNLASEELHPGSPQSIERADPRAVLDHLRIIIEPSLQECGAVLRWEVPREMPTVRGNRHGLLQVFLNLARNAIQALAEAERRELTVTALVESGRVLVRFHDTGRLVCAPGRLFQPFQPGASGTGLGLYVSRAIIRSFGGDLRYEPAPRGSCFAVALEPAGV